MCVCATYAHPCAQLQHSLISVPQVSCLKHIPTSSSSSATHTHTPTHAPTDTNAQLDRRTRALAISLSRRREPNPPHPPSALIKTNQSMHTHTHKHKPRLRTLSSSAASLTADAHYLQTEPTARPAARRHGLPGAVFCLRIQQKLNNLQNLGNVKGFTFNLVSTVFITAKISTLKRRDIAIFKLILNNNIDVCTYMFMYTYDTDQEYNRICIFHCLTFTAIAMGNGNDCMDWQYYQTRIRGSQALIS